jgi:hypothetical protein
MRALMGLIKDRHGTYHAQRKVPERLRAAVARVLDQGKERQSFLKKSLGTKDLKAANIRALPVLAWFNRVIRDATAIAAQAPAPSAMRSTLNPAEIARMSETTTEHHRALRKHLSLLTKRLKTRVPACRKMFLGGSNVFRLPQCFKIWRSRFSA